MFMSHRVGTLQLYDVTVVEPLMKDSLMRDPPTFFFSRPAFLKLKKKYFPVNEAMTKLYYSFKTSFCFLFRVVFVIAIVFIP